MTKTKKYWLGFLTFLPVLSFGLYFLSFFFLWFGMFSGSFIPMEESQGPPASFFAGFAFLFVLILITVVCSIGLLIYYIIHANKHFNGPDNQKLIWILVLVLAGIIGNIAYFFAVILPLKAPEVKTLPQET